MPCFLSSSKQLAYCLTELAEELSACNQKRYTTTMVGIGLAIIALKEGLRQKNNIYI